ncbi:uncharacterized protein yc1106_05847 [Curvularia clavata]|uniref:Uncharacterized protein n=1 Tax=Curvularia clavata TaxID=95742 RepID=A0A9Q8ZE48_CURCL|nr:uncharacterized protein yc1106_05847 [Curvularia clavata]
MMTLPSNERGAFNVTNVASTSLAKLREELGEPVASSLHYAPLDKLITKPQHHEPDAVSFMLLFGHVRQQWTDNMQEVWIILYPPNDEGGKAEVLFHSYDDATKKKEWHHSQNISSTADCAVAFKMPKKASQSKNVALAKYYFLEKLAAEEAVNNGISELKFPLLVNKSFLEGLKSACREFENESKSTPARSNRQPCTSLALEMSNQSSDTTLVEGLSQQRFCTKVQYAQELPIPAASRTSGETGRAAQTRAPRQDVVRVLADLYEKEMKLQADIADINDQLLALTEERLELEKKRMQLEEQRQKNEEERQNIEAQREELFKGLSTKDAFELGRTVEQSHNAKRRKLD